MMGRKALFKDRSTLSFGAFIGECLFHDFIIMIWYRALFRCLPALTYLQSMLILGALLFMSIILFGLVFSCDRTQWSAFFACTIPYGVYTVLVYRNTFKVRISVLLILGIILSGFFCVRILFRRSASGSRTRMLLQRAYRCLWGTSSIMAIASVCLCVPLLLQQMFTGGILYSSVKAETSFQPVEEMLEENMDTLLLLREEKWSGLSSDEKLSVLQTVANIERNYLGLPNELNVTANVLNDDLLGQYNDTTHTIIISLDVVEQSEARECLRTVTHECFHSYQARVVDVFKAASKENRKLRLFEAAQAYDQEYAHYDDGSSDIEGYWNQALEEDARAYAYEAVLFYYQVIN